jgi:transcriptional regulator with XRE-family HTH domain
MARSGNGKQTPSTEPGGAMKLAEWRKGQGKTQAEVAETLGVSQSQVAKFELGRIPNQRDMAKIRRVTRGQVTANDFSYQQPDAGTEPGATEPAAPDKAAAPDAMERARAAIDSAVENFHPVAATLIPDLRDFVLDLLRHMPKPWQQMTRAERREYAHIVDDACQELVLRAVELVETRDRISVPVGLEQVAFKPKGIEAKLTMGVLDRALRHALIDAQGSPVLLVVADATPYLGARRPPRLDDEPELPFGHADGQADGEARVEADLDRAIAAGEAGEDDEPTAEASAEHRDQGRADALLGFSETRNPWPEGTRAHASYRDGWAQGEAERQTAAAAPTTSGKRRRRRRVNGETEPAETSV